jgi:purine-nucleoside phosphorylase
MTHPTEPRTTHAGDPAFIRAREAAGRLRPVLATPPQVSIILGSGLSGAVDGIQTAFQGSSGEILQSPGASVAGHSGRVVLGTLSGLPIIAFLGRIHMYEGHSPAEQTLPVYLSFLLGARILLLTNASGAVNTEMRPGDLMIIRDQIDLTGRSVKTPAGSVEPTAPIPAWNDASTAAGGVYDGALTGLLHRAAGEASVHVHGGVYAGVLGPSYETAAEIRMLRRIGADAVGMSTVLEAALGRSLGMRVAGLSVITNLATGLSPECLSHEEVTAGAAIAGVQVRAIVERLLGSIRVRNMLEAG